LVKKLTVRQLKVELLKAYTNKILSVCTLIDDKNEPISAQEIGQLLQSIQLVNVNFMAYFSNVIMYTVKIQTYNRRTFATEDDIGMSKHVL